MKKQTIVKIARDGHAIVDTVGFQGKGCASASEAIQIALGAGIVGNSDDKKKPDFFVTEGLPISQAQG